jgi:hypothetical protein
MGKNYKHRACDVYLMGSHEATIPIQRAKPAPEDFFDKSNAHFNDYWDRGVENLSASFISRKHGGWHP